MTSESPVVAALIDARHERKLCQNRVAARVGCPPPMISRWETGSRTPTLRNLERWAAALGLAVTLTKGTP